MFLASGKLEEKNLSDYLTVQASLVAADKLYVMKKQVRTLITYACRSHDSNLVGCDGSLYMRLSLLFSLSS